VEGVKKAVRDMRKDAVKEQRIIRGENDGRCVRYYQYREIGEPYDHVENESTFLSREFPGTMIAWGMVAPGAILEVFLTADLAVVLCEGNRLVIRDGDVELEYNPPSPLKSIRNVGDSLEYFKKAIPRDAAYLEKVALTLASHNMIGG
jgi:hypothetical protein